MNYLTIGFTNPKLIICIITILLAFAAIIALITHKRKYTINKNRQIGKKEPRIVLSLTLIVISYIIYISILAVLVYFLS